MKTVLTQGGHAKASIVTPRSPDRVINFAAKELAKYLFRITEAGFPVKEEGDPSILPGKTILLKTPETQQEQDSYLLFSGEDGNIVIEGSNSRSILFGVYAFLEHLGVIFAGAFKEYIPAEKDLAVERFSISSKAAFRERSFFRSYNLFRKEYNFDGFDPVTEEPQIAFLAKRKCNIYVGSIDYNRYDLWDKFKPLIEDAIYDRGLKVHLLTNSLNYFFPDSENSDFGEYGKEYYLVNKPHLFDASGAPLISDPEVQEVIALRYAHFLADHKEVEKAAFAPKKDFFADKSPEEKKQLLAGLKLLSEKIMEKCRSLAPGKSFQLLLEEESLSMELPDGKEKTILVRSGTKLKFNLPFFHKENSPYRERIAELGKIPSPLTITEDIGDLPRFLPYWQEAKERLLYYRQCGAEGVFAFGGHSYNYMGNGFRWETDFYIFSSLLWDPEKDPAEILMQWCNTTYEECGKPVADLFLLLGRIYTSLQEKGLPEGSSFLDLAAFRKAQRFLEEARSLLPREKRDSLGEKLDKLESDLGSSTLYRIPDEESLRQDFYIK